MAGRWDIKCRVPKVMGHGRDERKLREARDGGEGLERDVLGETIRITLCYLNPGLRIQDFFPKGIGHNKPLIDSGHC